MDGGVWSSEHRGIEGEIMEEPISHRVKQGSACPFVIFMVALNVQYHTVTVCVCVCVCVHLHVFICVHLRVYVYVHLYV